MDENRDNKSSANIENKRPVVSAFNTSQIQDVYKYFLPLSGVCCDARPLNMKSLSQGSYGERLYCQREYIYHVVMSPPVR